MGLFEQLKAKISEDPGSFIVVLGAGASMPAGLPSWIQLRDGLCDALSDMYSDSDELEKAQKAVKTAPDLWTSFSRLKSKLGNNRYNNEITNRLDIKKLKTPRLYEQIWQLNVAGIINFNIDKFALNAYSSVSGFSADYATGNEPHKYLNFPTSDDKFVLYPHGIISDPKSWVFTSAERTSMYANEDFKKIITILLNSKNLIVVGFNATEWSFQELISNCGISGRINGNHNYYFRPNATEDEIRELDEKGIFVIRYTPHSTNHNEINQYFDDFISFKSVDPILPSVYKGKKYTVKDIPDDNECYHLSVDELRDILNGVIANIIPSDITPTESQLNELESFYNLYITQLHRAWLVDPRKEATSRIYQYQTKRFLGNGAFGSVFEAIDEEGNRYAIKVLLQEVKDKMSYLSCFRRGIRSMRILTEKGIKGMVKLHDSFEIPACLVMDLVDGITLREAIDKHYARDLVVKLYILSEVAGIIHAAHQLEERILHRDIKPENVMLENAYCEQDFDDPSNYPEIKVLDFDLSWHRGATEKTVTFGNASQGFMAPEQIDTSRDKSLSRSTAVDVYSIGMLAYYVLTGNNPVPNLSQFAFFSDNVYTDLKKKYKYNWKCLPAFLANTIVKATLAIPGERIPLDTFIQRIDIARKMYINEYLPCSHPLVLLEVAERVGSVDANNISDFGRVVVLNFIELSKRITLWTSSDNSLVKIHVKIERYANSSDKREHFAKFLKTSAEKAVSNAQKGLFSSVEIDNDYSSVRISLEAQLPKTIELSYIKNLSSNIVTIRQVLI